MSNPPAANNPDDDSLLVSLAIGAVTLCCLPCLCAAGSFLVLRHAITKAALYQRPSTRRRIAKERAEEEKRMEGIRSRRNVPKNVAPRKRWVLDPMSGLVEGEGVKMERHLTIGRPAEVERPGIVGVFTEDLEDGKISCVQEPVKLTNGQEQSTLFKLPLEIRRQIYEEVIGKYKIHISFNQTYRKMGHQRCRHRDGMDCSKRPCTVLHKQKGARDAWGQVDLLALLQSCRVIYGEAIEILYKENTFTFPKLGEVLKLSMTVLPERMALIKSVQWKVCYCSPTIHTTTPWLDCNKPHCSCVACLPDKTYSQNRVRRWIIYTWMMRSQENDSNAHALDHVSHASR